MKVVETTGLALEYQRDYGMASRHLNIADLAYDTRGQSPIRIFGLGLQEQSVNCRFVELCTIFDDGADALLVGLNCSEPLT